MATVAEAMQHITGWPRNIEWSEFQGQVPSERREDAKIVALPDLRIRPGRVAGRMIGVDTLQVRVVVSEQQSWAVESSQTARLLRHEQVHYDIAGMGARDLTRRVLDTRAPNVRAFWSILRTHRREVQAQVDRVNHRYDTESKHFRDVDEQHRWEGVVREAMERGTELEHL